MYLKELTVIGDRYIDNMISNFKELFASIAS